MAGKQDMGGMTGGGKKTRGRTSITNSKMRVTDSPEPSTKINAPAAARTESNRPVKSGAGKHRGDRRDTSTYYTNNEKHAARGSNPRKDITTRKR